MNRHPESIHIDEKIIHISIVNEHRHDDKEENNYILDINKHLNIKLDFKTTHKNPLINVDSHNPEILSIQTIVINNNNLIITPNNDTQIGKVTLSVFIIDLPRGDNNGYYVGKNISLLQQVRWNINPLQLDIPFTYSDCWSYENPEVHGEQFYFRISPHYIIINREYYKNLKNIKGYKIKSENTNELFLEASKKVQKNDWEGAAQIWKKFVNHKNDQVSSRACFNMALACEANGKINLAIDWIKKSINFGSKKGAIYLISLKERKKAQEKLNNQL